MEFILSVAHYKKAKGARYGSMNEYDISRPITMRVAEMLEAEGIKCHVLDDKKIWQKKKLVADIVNNTNDECLCVEFHFNQAKHKGVCILVGHDGNADDVDHRTKEGRMLDNEDYEYAKICIDTLSEDLNQKRHASWWNGIIPMPSSYRDSRLTMTNELECASFIVELDSIDRAGWFRDNVERTAKSILKSFKLIKESSDKFWEENG